MLKSLAWLAALFALVWAGLGIASLFTVTGSTARFSWRSHAPPPSPALPPTSSPASSLEVKTYVLGRHKALGAEYVVTHWNIPTPQGWRAEVRKDLFVPLWHFLVVFCLVAGIWAVPRTRARHRLRSRQAGGLCLNCGYDLRGNSSPRCPECGSKRRFRASRGRNEEGVEPRIGVQG